MFPHKRIFVSSTRAFAGIPASWERLCAWVPESCQPLGNGSERTTKTERQRERPYGTSPRRSPKRARNSVQATKPAAPVVAVALPFQSTVQLPFPRGLPLDCQHWTDGCRRSPDREILSDPFLAFTDLDHCYRTAAIQLTTNGSGSPRDVYAAHDLSSNGRASSPRPSRARPMPSKHE